MTLRDELLTVLRAESAYPPMTPASLGRVLHAIGFSPDPSETEIVQALEGLMSAGHVEAVHRDRGDMSEPTPPTAA